VLYASKGAQAHLSPSVISLYPGAVGASRTLEAYGQRDEAAIMAFGEALVFQTKIGKPAIERRARELAAALVEGLKKMEGVKIWTNPDPQRSAAVVSFQPGALDPRRLGEALYERERIACSTRAGEDRPGLRFSPHFYNLHAEVDRSVAAIARYVRSGV
jgi:selenocysteine lyase/cysteine desulfurase